MLDAEQVILAELERLAAAPAPGPDWGDVRARARTLAVPASGGRMRLLVATGAAAVAVVAVAVAIAAAVGGFSGWLSGQPGVPATRQAQAAFDRSTRSWRGFPRSTQLRRLIAASIAGTHYTLYGFRGAGSLCLQLVAGGSALGGRLACAPLAELRATSAPALVVATDLGIGGRGATVSQGPLTLPASGATVSFGVLADGVDRIQITHQTPATTRVLIGGDAFLAISPGLSPFDATTAITAYAGNAHATVPFARQPTPYGFQQPPAPAPTPTGPSTVQRVVKGGAIRWFARRQPRGEPVPRSLHAPYRIAGRGVIFARMLAPDPAIPERVVLSIRPAGHAYFGGRLPNNRQVCADLAGGRYSGGGCWPAGRLFSTAPFAAAVTIQYGGQVVALPGVASDDVARLTLFPAAGKPRLVPLRDNVFIGIATLSEYPLRLVAYDSTGRVIGIKTYQGDLNAPPMPHPTPGAPWHVVLRNGTGAVYRVRSASGGSCVGFRESSGAATIDCDHTVPPDGLALSTTNDETQSVILGEVGTRIARIRVVLRSGTLLTITPTHEVVLHQLPHVSRDPSAGVAVVQGLDGSGHVVASRTFRR